MVCQWLGLSLPDLAAHSQLGGTTAAHPVGKLQAARFLIPLLTVAAAIKALLALFSERWQRLRLCWLRGHVLICRLSHKGQLLANSFLQARRAVVIVERNPLHPQILVLRQEGVLYFMDYFGSYLLADSVIQVEAQDLPEDALDFAIRQNKLRIGIVSADSQSAVVRQRVGQDRIRKAVLENYGCQCAFCDIQDAGMLIASHISRWADDPEGRGDLTNIISMCRFHDVLFEKGYFSLADDGSILKKQVIQGEITRLLLDRTCELKPPYLYAPSPIFLQKHRARTGF